MSNSIRLSKFRPCFVVINMVVSALLTPPDPVSMMMLALPVQFIYEVIAFAARLSDRKKDDAGAKAA